MYFVQLDTALLVSQSYRVAVSNSNISVTANRDTHVTFNVTAKVRIRQIEFHIAPSKQLFHSTLVLSFLFISPHSLAVSSFGKW